MTISRRNVLGLAALAASVMAIGPALAAGTYDPGASDTEIKIGNTCSYSGPISSNSVIGRSMAAYFKMINDKGGVNGRKITFLSYDDGFSPPKTVEQVRRLVENDGVLAMFGMIGSGPNAAVAKYLNGKEIPALFIGSGASNFINPDINPWTLGYIPNYATEAEIYGKAIIAANPNAKIALLYQNDDFGKDYLNGLKKGLGVRVNQLVLTEPYDTTEPTIDSHIINAKASGADTFVMAAIGKFASQTIRKVAELGWKPTFYSTNSAVAVQSVLEPAGLDNAKSIISAAYLKDPSDKVWADDADMKEFFAFMDKYNSNDPKNNLAQFGYITAQLMVHVLEKAGDNLTRKNLMNIATSLKNVRVKTMLPGITVTTSPTDYRLVEQFQLMRFDGAEWKLFGDVISTGG